MSGQRKWRHCNKCERKYPSPTGKKCKGVYLDVFSDSSRDFDKELETVGIPNTVAGSEAGSPLGSGCAGAGPMEHRLSCLEDMLSQLLIKEEQSKKPARTSSSPFASDAEEDDSCEQLSRRLKSKRRFCHSKFLEESETVSTFEGVMLVGLRTIQHLVEEGRDPKPLYKHLEFIAKKATIGRYKYKAFVGFDSRVRDRAGAYGIQIFAEMSAEDVATFFCAKNMWISKDKPGKKGSESGRRKQGNPCLLFNNSSCTYKFCNIQPCLPCLRGARSRP